VSPPTTILDLWQVARFCIAGWWGHQPGQRDSRNGATVDAVMNGRSYQPRRVAKGAVMGVRWFISHISYLISHI
jgi:hypothetical protein